MPSFVAYYRVSTQRQGRSGLGLEAQRQAVATWLSTHDGELIGEYIEVETGKGANALDRRPELRAALGQARRAKATLVIAKLDRLARNVHFISGLIEQRVPIVAADMPEADITMLQIYAAMAEREARVTGERTRAALSAAKARGVILGANGQTLAAKNKHAAGAALEPLRPLLARLRAEGLSVRAMATRLNQDGVATPAGGRWHASNLHRALMRLSSP